MKALTNGITRYIVTDADCWEWLGDKSDQGYGRIMIGGITHYTHRVSYQLHIGPINRGMEIDHLCRNRACMNPHHLEMVTSAENTRRGNHPLAIVVRLQVCRRGHDLTSPANVYERPNGKRRCRVCSTMTQAERRQLGRNF